MAKSDDLRKRLEALNRGPLAPGEGGPDEAELRRRLETGRRTRRKDPRAEPIVFRRDPSHAAGPRRPALAGAGPHVELAEAVSGTEATAPDGGRAYLVERRVEDPQGRWRALCDALADAVRREGSGLWAQAGQMLRPAEVNVEDLIFLDLETTGLGSSPLFLVGTMAWDAGGLVVRQYFARDYSEERAAVYCFLRLCEGRKLLISFNGKSFDLPFVRMRAAANGLICRFDPPHLDLLHVARRVWRDRVPDCKLQTLERVLCGRPRTDDIPGHLIPDAYHEYVRTRNAVRMVNVLEHNFLDLVTLADLIVRLPGPP